MSSIPQTESARPQRGNLERPCDYCGASVRYFPCYPRLYCSQACYHAARLRPLAERFWSHVDKSGGSNACWLWTGSKSPRGYGQFNSTGHSRSAHRLAWELTFGPILPIVEVCHNCPGGDNPSCVNPAHLFLGTRMDNVLDAMHKGRVRKGSRHGMARLTEAAVLDMRARYAAHTATVDELAAAYGVSPGTVESVIYRWRWKHL